MRLIPQFLSQVEVDELLELWREVRDAGHGWEVKKLKQRVYDFYPCLRPPELVRARAMAELPGTPRAKYWDSFFIHYVDGDSTPTHVDSRSGARLNVCLITPHGGGHLMINEYRVILARGAAVIFEPSKEIHSVTPVQGERLIWSIGRTLDPFCGGNEKCPM